MKTVGPLQLKFQAKTSLVVIFHMKQKLKKQTNKQNQKLKILKNRTMQL